MRQLKLTVMTCTNLKILYTQCIFNGCFNIEEMCARSDILKVLNIPKV